MLVEQVALVLLLQLLERQLLMLEAAAAVQDLRRADQPEALAGQQLVALAARQALKRAVLALRIRVAAAVAAGVLVALVTQELVVMGLLAW